MSSEPELGTETTEPDNINIGLIATITVVGALLVVSIAAALTALVRTEAARYSDEVGAYANLGEVSRLKEAQRGKLSEGPQWADRAKGLASIPIDRAMRLVVTDLERNPNLATPWKPGEEPDAGAPEQGEAPGQAPTGAASGTAAPGEAPTGAPAGSAGGETGMAGDQGAAKSPEKAASAEGASAGTEKKPAAAEATGQGAPKGATPMPKQPEAPASGAAPAPPQE